MLDKCTAVHTIHTFYFCFSEKKKSKFVKIRIKQNNELFFKEVWSPGQEQKKIWFCYLHLYNSQLANAISEQRGTTLHTGSQKQPSPVFVKARCLQLPVYYFAKNPIQITAEFKVEKLTELEHITKLARCILQHYPLEFKAAL